MLATGCLTKRGQKSVKWEVITTIAAAGISAAMEQPASGEMPKRRGGAPQARHPGVLVAVYIATFFLCTMGKRRVALMCPRPRGRRGRGVDRDQMPFLLARGVRVVHVPFRYHPT